jgi:hypothetical protein
MLNKQESIGIKQVIRYEWMQQTANLLLAGLDPKGIREELHAYLLDKKGNGSIGTRSDQTRNFAVGNLMMIWVPPAKELIPFRDAALAMIQKHPKQAMPVHWSMISAAYPFWFNVARQTGRLLALQEQVTQNQIVKRLKEHYGDRQTVSRYAQYVIRSFVAWGVLKDSKTVGCYEKARIPKELESDLAILMIESALFTMPDKKCALGLLVNNPAFFPFQMPLMTGEYISQYNKRIQIDYHGFEDDIISLIDIYLNS